jgi:hypothetical protein
VDIVNKQEFQICKYEMASSGMNVAIMASFKKLSFVRYLRCINARCDYDICKENVEDVSLKSTWTVLFNIKFDYRFQADYNGHVGRNMW